MTNGERIGAIQRFGYTEREAAFLCLAALHGGYFLQRQYNAFLERHSCGTTRRLIQQGLIQRHLRVHESANRTLIYHVGATEFFRAIGDEDNRNCRWRQPFSVEVKLMGQDFVLAHPEHHYLATEADKLDYFIARHGLTHSHLPQRTYRAATRYFVDKFPLFLSGASSAPSPVVTFCYVDGSTGKPSGFDTYLLQYRELFSRLDRFVVIYVAADERMFAKAERIFKRSWKDGVEAVSVAKYPDIERLREHFWARDLFERRETSSFGKSRLDRLREELNEFGGPQYEALYRRWREQGDRVLAGSPHSPGKGSGDFATYRLDHDYELFGELDRKISA